MRGLAAEDYRRRHQDISGQLALTAAMTDQTLVAAKTGFTVFIQMISFYVTTDAAQSLAFENSDSSLKFFEVTTSPGDETLWQANFGARGVSLGEGLGFLANVSAAGLAGLIVWEGYRALTGVVTADALRSA